MNELFENGLNKADAALADRIRQLRQHHGSNTTRLRVLLTLAGDRASDEDHGDTEGNTHKRAKRSALIEKRRAAIGDALAAVRERLSALSLTVKGGTVSRVVVCEGNAADIARALEDPDVINAVLDKPTALKIERP